MNCNSNIKNVIEQFVTDVEANRYGNGHINETYLIEPCKYILQKINTDIFTNCDELMQNISNVTEFLRKKIVLSGGDPDRETLTVISTINGDTYYRDDNGNCYRMYLFINNTNTVNSNPTAEQLYSAAKAFGRFQNMLNDYPADTLFETIKDFHNTPDRFAKLEKAIKDNIAGRRHLVEKEIEFALSCKDWVGYVTEGIASGDIPLRVTHNDTKINNVMFDADTNETICVIDLDTVMPGSMLYDFGDALRIGAATADEDETDLSKVEFDLTKFEAFAKGFVEEMADSMTAREGELLAFSAKLLTYECGIRFLTDYLNGDTYFKIHRENHNLDRARTQFKLVADMDKKMDKMNDIVKKYLK